MADAGHPPPGGRLTSKAAARIPCARAARRERSGMREGSDQLAQQEALTAIARGAQNAAVLRAVIAALSLALLGLGAVIAT